MKTNKKNSLTVGLAMMLVPVAAHSMSFNIDTAKTIDMLTGAFQIQTVLTVESQNTADKTLSFQYQYNSHSLHRGWLGLGWCTPFEIKLEIRGPKNLVLHDCQLGDEPRPFQYRSQKNQYTLLGSKQIVVDKRGVRGYRMIDKSTPQQTTIDFDTAGNVIRYNQLVLKLSGPNEIEISDLKNAPLARLFLKISAFGRQVTQIKFNTARERLNYNYDSAGRLVKVTASGKSDSPAQTLTKYKYDSLDNVIRITERRYDITSISYNQDRVHEVKTDRCHDIYSYSTHQREPADAAADLVLHKITVHRQWQCGENPINRQTYNFILNGGS